MSVCNKCLLKLRLHCWNVRVASHWSFVDLGSTTRRVQNLELNDEFLSLHGEIQTYSGGICRAHLPQSIAGAPMLRLPAQCAQLLEFSSCIGRGQGDPSPLDLFESRSLDFQGHATWSHTFAVKVFNSSCSVENPKKERETKGPGARNNS